MTIKRPLPNMPTRLKRVNASFGHSAALDRAIGTWPRVENESSADNCPLAEVGLAVSAGSSRYSRLNGLLGADRPQPRVMQPKVRRRVGATPPFACDDPALSMALRYRSSKDSCSSRSSL